MSFNDDVGEFCRKCGVSVSWTSEVWVHDYVVEDEHEPVVPTQNFYEEDL